MEAAHALTHESKSHSEPCNKENVTRLLKGFVVFWKATNFAEETECDAECDFRCSRSTRTHTRSRTCAQSISKELAVPASLLSC